ncbi:acyl-phosphate glycerol 3-phosphate acyltransferase [Candidatus Saccharibacteria bacterium]|nr:acyl-phosphate glycerol 3-phosphate acyltransferase [Candidatus Saccharibacteria bacterium]
MTKRIQYYKSFEQDFAASKRQNYCLPDDYDYRGGWTRRIGAWLLYPLILLIDLVYMKLVAGVKVENRRVLRGVKGGYFLYANHTQLFGDVVNPFLITRWRRPYIVCSAANLGIAVLGPLLPTAGALPIPEDLRGMRRFSQAVEACVRKHPVVVYPEGHLWPWCTEIRPLAAASFHYPAKYEKPVFVATTTYRKSRWRKKPRAIIYLDGPFEPDATLGRKVRQAELARKVAATMQQRAKLSDFVYVEYRPKR